MNESDMTGPFSLPPPGVIRPGGEGVFTFNRFNARAAVPYSKQRAWFGVYGPDGVKVSQSGPHEMLGVGTTHIALAEPVTVPAGGFVYFFFTDDDAAE